MNLKWWIQQQSGPSGHFGLLTVIGIARQGKLLIDHFGRILNEFFVERFSQLRNLKILNLTVRPFMT